MTGTIDDLAAKRDEFVGNPGTDPDYDGIVDEIGNGEEDTRTLNALWFDHVMTRFRDISRSGTVTVYRRISVGDTAEFLSSIGRRPLGCSWSWDEESASCHYHPEANHEHEILLTAQAPLSSICWEDCMVQHFGHPHEREMVVEGQVRDLIVTLEDRVLGRMTQAEA